MINIQNIIENIDESYGGPAKSVPFLCMYLEKMGIKTEINSVRLRQNETNDLIERNNIDWKSFSYKYFPFYKYSPELSKYLKKKVDITKNIILHTQNQWNYIPICAYKISKKYNVPLICSVRGAMSPWALNQYKYIKKLFWFLFQKKIFQEADCIHCTTDVEASYIRNAGIKTPIAVIPNGVDLLEFENPTDTETAKKTLGLDRTKKYLLFMGRIHKSKGLDIFVKAWKDIYTCYPDWNIIYAGPIEDKKYNNELESYKKQNNLNSSVKYLGLLKGKQRILAYRAAKIFVSPTFSENFGISIAEAMAAGLPVITTKGAPWKVIQSKKCGWWIDLDLETLKSSLNEALWLEQNKLFTMGNIAKKIIYDDFSWEIQAAKMLEVYEWLLNRKEKPKFVYKEEI